MNSPNNILVGLAGLLCFSIMEGSPVQDAHTGVATRSGSGASSPTASAFIDSDLAGSGWAIRTQPSLARQEMATAGDVQIYRIPGTDITFDMIAVPGGSFMMGNSAGPQGAASDTTPIVEVTLEPFLIGSREVTYDEYVIFQYPDRDSDSTAVEGKMMDLDAVARPSTPYEDPAFGMGGFGYPAVGMTQWGALQYARWLSEKTGEFFRLPTEAEWEYACRAASNDGVAGGADGSDVSAVAWYEANSDYRLHRVGGKQPNRLGIFDMLGNAAEWTLDQYDKDYYASLTGPDAVNPWRRPERLHPRTVRGGSYGDDLEAVSCTARQESSVNWKRRDPQIPKSFWWNTDSPFVGFRLVRPLNPPSPEEQEEFWILVLGE